MKFYQYWLIIIIALLVIISIYNIIKMIVLISKSKYPKIDNDDVLNRNIRNLLVSIGLLSVIALVYIFLVFKQLT
ncbi:MAG: hypothetical protein IJ572_01795 [Bacilli bacterium]|nr:hypothetical protein [Bacilli bacterium]